MKNSKWLLVAGLVIMMMAVGCKKMGDQVDVAGTAANPLVLPIYGAIYGQDPVPPANVLVGHVWVWDDANTLYVKYLMDVTQPDGSGFELYELKLDVRMDSMSIPWTSGDKPWVNLEEFGFESNPWGGLKEYTFTIPDYGAWLTGSKAAMVAYCTVHEIRADNSGGDMYFGWAQDLNHPFKWGCGWWFPYTFEVPHDGEWHMNTAWGGKAYPNWKDWQFLGKNWALYIKYNVDLQSEYVGSLYAGNPKNDAASKVVGTVTVSDDVVAGVGNIYVTYNITKEDRALFSGHTIVRGRLADIPQKNGNPIPGQFDEHWGPFDPPEDGVTVTIPYDPAWGTNLFVGAHAEVGWYY